MTELPGVVGLHIGSTLNHYVFVLVIDNLMLEIQDELSWFLLLVNVIVLISEKEIN